MKFLDDLLVLAGAGMITYAVSQINTTAAWFVAGVFCLSFGIVIGRAQLAGEK